MNIIVKKRFSYRQCMTIEEFNQDNYDLLNPSAILRLHKSSSYMVYIVKDLADYLSKKTSKGDYMVAIQYAINDNLQLNKRVSALKEYLK